MLLKHNLIRQKKEGSSKDEILGEFGNFFFFLYIILPPPSPHIPFCHSHIFQMLLIRLISNDYPIPRPIPQNVLRNLR